MQIQCPDPLKNKGKNQQTFISDQDRIRRTRFTFLPELKKKKLDKIYKTNICKTFDIRQLQVLFFETRETNQVNV